MASTTPVCPIETQLRTVVPELCVNDVPESVAEVEVSSANPVKGDPLPDWLQPFDENLVMTSRSLAEVNSSSALCCTRTWYIS